MRGIPADTPAANSVDGLAATLRKDPVLVSPLFGNGHTTQVRAGFHHLIDDAGFPVYVVMTTAPAGLQAGRPADELATLLHTRLGDGVYLISLDATGYSSTERTFGDGLPSTSVVYSTNTKMTGDSGGFNKSVSQAGSFARDLDVMIANGKITRKDYDSYATSQVWRSPPEWDPVGPEPPTTGDYVAKGGLTFVLVAGAVFLVLRNLMRWRETANPSRVAAAKKRREQAALANAAPDLAGLRRQVETELTSVATRLGSDAGAPNDERAQGSYDNARRLLERTGDTERDLLDLVGALVLTRIAGRALEPRGRKQPRLYRACFFDPRHGEGTRRRSVPVAEATLAVPCCPACAEARAADLTPLTVRRGRRRVPYYETAGVWASTGFGAFVDDLWQEVGDDLRERRR